jgi:hypothetical protein
MIGLVLTIHPFNFLLIRGVILMQRGMIVKPLDLFSSHALKTAAIDAHIGFIATDPDPDCLFGEIALDHLAKLHFLALLFLPVGSSLTVIKV